MSKPSSPPFKRSLRWTPVEARAALAALKSSGLSAMEFARREGLDRQRLRAWERRLGAKRSPTSARLGTPTSPTAAPTFIEIAPPVVDRVEVVLPSGVVLRVAATVDPGALRRIVEALEGGARC